MKKQYINIAVFLLLLISFSGCIGVNQEFKEVRNLVYDILGNDHKKEIEIGLGAAGLSFAGTMVRFVENEHMPADILSHLSSVQFGVYINYRSSSLGMNSDKIRVFCSSMQNEGWKYIVKVVDVDEVSMVFIDNDLSEGVKKMLVINSDNREMVIAELKGDLEEIVAEVIKNKQMGIKIAHN